MRKAVSQLSVVFTLYRGTQLTRSYTQVSPQTFASTASTMCQGQMSSQVRALMKRFMETHHWFQHSLGFFYFGGIFFSIREGAKHLF